MIKHNHPPRQKKETNEMEHSMVRDKFFTRLHNWDARKADEKLKACPVCKRVWESINENKSCAYYTNFPTYGKLKMICEQCL